MDEEVRRELHRLRARAYGPDADIDEDPTAVARLATLEELDRHERTPPPEVSPTPRPPVTASVASVPQGDGESPAGDDEGLAGEDDDVDRERSPLVRSPRTVWAWAISLAVVTALASAATALTLAVIPVSSSAGAAQVGTLEPDPDGQTPAIFGQRASAERAFQDFYGVTAFVGLVQTDATENLNPCVYLLETAEVSEQEARGFSGSFAYGGCGAGIFPATVAFVVADGMPDAFVERFPVGTSVQFVFDGENVGVFADRG